MSTPFLKSIPHQFEIQNDLLLARWPFSVRYGSPLFYDFLPVLFHLIKENGIKKLLLEAGTSHNGSLTEEVITLIEKQVLLLRSLRKLALLESADFHWDNNMAQLINYLISALNLEVRFRLFTYREEAIAWLQEV